MSIFDTDQIITQEDAKAHQGEITAWASAEIQQSDTFIEGKLSTITEQVDRMMNPQIAQEERGYVKLYTSYINRKAFQATFQQDAFHMKFLGQEYSDEDKAYHLEKMAEKDFDLMGRRAKNRQKLGHLWDYGVYIEIPMGYNPHTNVVEYSVINPESWRPQIVRDVTTQSFQHHFFRVYSSLADLKRVNAIQGKEVYFNLDKLDEESSSTRGDNRQAKRGLSTSFTKGRMQIVHGVKKVGGRRYHCSFDSECQILLRREPHILTHEEKKNPRLTPDPVNVCNIMPIERDPMGLSPLSMIIDKQDSINKLVNLGIKKEERNTFQKYLVNLQEIGDISLLTKDTSKGDIYVPRSKKSEGKNVIEPMYPQRGLDVGKFNLSDKIESYIENQTGFTEQNRGIAQGGETLGQSKIVQENSNKMLSLDASELADGEKRFYMNIWYRSIHVFLPRSKKKLLRIGSGLTGKKLEISRDSLIGYTDFDIQIKSITEREKERASKLIEYNQMYPLIMQDQSIKPIQKRYFLRELMELKGYSREKIMLFTKGDKDEERALGLKELIDSGLEVDLTNIFKPGMDLFTYWLIVSKAKDSELKDKIVSAIEFMMYEAGEDPQEVQGQLGQVANSVASQTTANLISKQNQNLPTLNPGA